jgi:hypothetical protein
MDFATWIITLIAPLTPGQRHALIARIFAGIVLERLQRSLREAAAIADPTAREAFLLRHCQAHHMLLRIAEEQARLALWLTARAACGGARVRVHLHLPPISTTVPPGALFARLEALARHLDSVEDDAGTLAASWRSIVCVLAEAGGGASLALAIAEAVSRISLTAAEQAVCARDSAPRWTRPVTTGPPVAPS